jgi:hypothetical protein
VATVGGLDPGDWATWATAAVSLFAFGAVVVGLRIESRNRRADIERLDGQRRDDQLSAQARQVGATISWLSGTTTTAGITYAPIQLRVVNASNLPIRNLQGHLSEVGTFEPTVARFAPVPIVDPNIDDFTITLQVRNDVQYLLQLEFDDDAGIRWSKYGPTGLTRVDQEHP